MDTKTALIYIQVYQSAIEDAKKLFDSIGTEYEIYPQMLDRMAYAYEELVTRELENND